jgi:hypothetical protein
MILRHAWLQKHPSPSASGGEFHWHPPDRDRELRASCVERLRGIEPPAVLWTLAPGRVAWAQLFAATAPVDRRSYVGVVLTVAEGDVPARLLASLAAPEPAPWREAAPEATAAAAPELDLASVARALISGGQILVSDPASPRLAAQLAAMERWMPAIVTDRAREGACTARRTTRGPRHRARRRRVRPRHGGCSASWRRRAATRSTSSPPRSPAATTRCVPR